MKSILYTVLLALVVAGAAAAETPSIAGNWKVQMSVAGNENEMACTFTQKETELTGSCKSEQGTMPITGKVTEAKVTWSAKIDYNGSPLTLSYAGKRDGDSKITGTVTVEEFSVEGEFVATVVK